MSHIRVGYSLFSKPWVEAPSSTKRRDGLGPYFNAVSCISCHQGMGRGAPKKGLNTTDPFVVYKSNSLSLKELYGEQLSPKALSPLKSERTVYTRSRPFFKNGAFLSLPSYFFLNGDKAYVSPRIAPHLAGLGMLAAIKEEDIISNLKNGGTLSLNKGRLARFGLKAFHIGLEEQVASAFVHDMGITNSLFPEDICNRSDDHCLNIISGADEKGVEIRDDHLKMVVKLLDSIKPPAPLYKNPKSIKGEKHFENIKCISCHRKSYETSRGKIYPYTDMLLHDMGKDLSDRAPPGEKSLNDKLWRTPPLWGLGSQAIVNNHTRLLHDGRAKNINEAILWHGGEAKLSVSNFLKLDSIERNELIYFLKSL